MAWRKMLTNLLISLTPWLFCAGVSLDVSLNPIVNCLCWSYLKSSTHTPSVSASMVMPIKPHSLLMNQERGQRVNGFDLVPIVNPQLGQDSASLQPKPDNIVCVVGDFFLSLYQSILFISKVTFSAVCGILLPVLISGCLSASCDVV